VGGNPERETDSEKEHTMQFQGRSAVVTGGGNGIGRAIAMALAKEGAKVALWDVDTIQAAQTAAKIEAGGGTTLCLKVDVSVGTDVKTAVMQTRNTWGRIDILINNAGICDVTPIEKISEDEWDRVLAVNLKGTFLCSQAVMPVMQQQRSGRIINMGSVAGKLGGIAVGAHYAASKAAVMCFTKSLARALATYNVTVNAISPGVIETDMTRAISGGDWEKYLSTIPLRRLGTAEELAKIAVFLASDDAAYLTGEIIDVNGGQLMD
jgi:3-oxoacyl-[acyl-carrier protein] reductase